MKRLSLLLLLVLFSCTKDPVMYDVTVSATEGGTVSPQSGTFEEGSSVTFTATPIAEYLFTKWSNGSTQNPLVLTVTSDLTLQATFTKKQYELTISKEGEGTVSERVINTGKGYDSGTKVELTAVPAGEWVFAGWSGDVTSNDNPLQVTISSPKNIKAKFVMRKYPLTISIEGQGTVTEEIVNTGKTTEYDSGTTVRLTAQPSEGWEFSGWSGDIESTSLAIELDVSQAISVKAKFIRFFNYKVPSFIWKNEIQPRLDLFEIEESNGYPKEYFSNTGYAVADFNLDGYIDLMIQNSGFSDSEIRYHKFFINDGENNFIENNSLLLNPEFGSLGARKTIVGDFNNDTYPDVIRISGAHDVLDKSTITLSNENGNYLMSKLESVPYSQYHGFASGDIDNDGDLDLFFGSPSEDQGFALNDGKANFYFEKVVDRISNLPENSPLYGVQTVEIFDFNGDNFQDLILGGSFADMSYDKMLISPTIIWGDGSGKFDYNNRSNAFSLGQKPYVNNIKTGNNDDLVFFDINQDGLNEIIALFIIQIDDDPNNNGLTTMYSFLQIYSPDSNFNFSNKTTEWFNDDEYIFQHPVTWIQIRDINGNGKVDIVETETRLSRPGYWTAGNESIHFEWDGTKFVKIN